MSPRRLAPLPPGMHPRRPLFRGAALVGVLASLTAPLLTTRVAFADEPAEPKEPPKAEPPKVPEKKGDLIPAEKEPAEKEPAKPAGVAAKPEPKGEVQSDDWWTHTRPIIEVHGFFRTRGEVFHNFSLGRVDPPAEPNRLFPRPVGDTYDTIGAGGTAATSAKINGCGADSANPGAAPSGQGPTTSDGACRDKTHASANLRFRIDPEIHISDNVRILSQIDLLDNLVLGSTPEGFSNQPAATGAGYKTLGRTGYVPLTAFSSTQVAPQSGINSYTDSILVKRVWAEVLLPNIGQIRFGRMPSHWGLGMLANSGDTIDSDYQSTSDRIMFATGLRSLDLYFVGAWDFPNSGRTSQTAIDQQGQPYNLSQLANTNQWVLSVFRRLKPEQLRARLAKGDTVVQGGAYVVYRQQLFANENTDANGLGVSDTTYGSKLVRLAAKALISDLWLNIRTRRLRWETEAVYVHGSIENPVGVTNNEYIKDDYKVRQFGVASELEYKALNDDLTLRFYTGFASGDQGVASLAPTGYGLQPRLAGDKTISTFRFHPDYRIDLILFRNILTRVQGAYYFKPGVQYDFTRSADGERFGGRADIIYSRASKFVQTPGHKEDLGVELDFTLYYQSRDGNLNDDPNKIGGFYTMLQYGVLFPLGGLGYMQNQPGMPEISSAQIVRLYLGVVY